MPGILLNAQIDPRLAAWFMSALGILTLVWTGYNWMTGEMGIAESPTGETVRQADDPLRFRRMIIVCLFGSVVMFATAAYFLCIA